MKRLKFLILSLIAAIAASATPTLPKFSSETEEHWYHIIFSAGEASAEDMAVMVNAIPKKGKDAQLWKLIGTADGFKLQCKNGRYAFFNSNIYTTDRPEQVQTFRLVASENPNYSDSWEIEYPEKGDAWNRWNQWGNTGPGVRIGLYTPGESNNALKFIPDEDLPYCPAYTAIPEFSVAADTQFQPEERHSIWFTSPATAQNVGDQWMEYGLPIGCGDFGAMTFGGVAQDRIQFNDKSLWSGSPTTRGCFQNFGDLYIEDISGVFGNSADKALKDYARWLDMARGVSAAKYSSPDGSVNYTREYIASYPQRCVAVRLAADRPGQISVRLRLFNGIKNGMLAPTYSSDGLIQFASNLDLVDFKATVKALPKGGTMTATDEYIEISGADELVLILAGATNFDPHSPTYISSSEAMRSRVDQIVENAVAKGWENLLAEHVADFSEYFGRVDFQINAAANVRATDNAIMTSTGRGSSPTNPWNLMVQELYYAFGRYLLISCSRGLDTPANLQGLWNHSSSPAWQSDIHSNINVQMNYWLAESTNLSEMHMPFLNYLHSMVTEHGEWSEYARRSGQTKGWTCFTQNNIFGHSDYAENYVIANAWYATHLWQHYIYTLDREFLRTKALPVILGSVDFWMERLIQDTDGTWVAPKEWSPEHGPAEEDGTAHAQQILHELFNNALEAIEVLGEDAGVDAAYKQNLRDKLANLDRGLATEEYVGKTTDYLQPGDLLLREWKKSAYTVGEQQHRHQSHLMAMYPFGDITPESEWFTPAINSLNDRGDVSTGWSLAWRIALWARALDGNRAHTIIRSALRHATSYGQSSGAGGIYYNLLDSHAPFQIDGNFGYTAAVTEMLMQSHGGVIRLLPALPDYWAAGHISGLKAIGDFEIDQKWEEGKLTEAKVKAIAGGTCRIKHAGVAKATVSNASGAPATFTAEGDDMIVLTTNPGDEILIQMADGSGVAEIEVPSEEAAEYFDLMGLKVANPEKGIYICRHGARTQKVIFK